MPGTVAVMQMNQILAATAQARFPARKRGIFTKPSSLRWKVLSMISTNSLAAFTQEVTRTRPGTEPSPVQRNTRPEAEQVAQRKLEAVPPAPTRPLPRGSLLDLRV
jgi:hypothetical protein